jgi:hypothetical protein
MAKAAGNRMSIIASAASRYRLTRPPPIDRLQRPYTSAERAFWPCKIATRSMGLRSRSLRRFGNAGVLHT